MSMTRRKNYGYMSQYAAPVARFAYNYAVQNPRYVKSLAKNAYKAYYGSPNTRTYTPRPTKRSTYTRKPKAKKRTYKRKTKQQKLRKKVANLARKVESDMGTLVWKGRSTGRILAAENGTKTAGFTGMNVSGLDTVLAELKYYDPANPTVLVTADGESGSYQREFLIQTIYTKTLLRNNYQVPCKVSMYVCVPKEDTGVTPITYFANGLEDVGNPNEGDPLIYPSDSPMLMDMYKFVKTKSQVLEPGGECTLSFSKSNVTYDTSLIDTHSSAFQARLGGHTYMIRVEGILGHDTVAAEYGTLSAAVDYLVDKKVVVKYNAGADIKTIVVANDSDDFTNSAVVSSNPVSDNLPYSVA